MRRLRGHHLVCLHFFRGQGYSPAFVDNLADVLGDIVSSGAMVTEGADDVCAACPTLGDDGRCVHSPDADAGIRSLDALALELHDVRPGQRVGWATLRERLPEVLPRWREEACGDCEWSSACADGIRELLGE